MSHPDIQKARVWAEELGRLEGPLPGLRAAVEVILSLPDQWIDAEKIEKLLTVWRSQLEECDHADGHTVMITCINDLAFEIATRSLPTLADMTPEERQACQWMQADVKLASGGSARCVIANPRLPGARVRVWAPHGGSDDVEEGRVTPLPGEPKLEWPGSAPDNVAYVTGGALTTQDVVDECRAVRKERALPRPEDVPAREPWAVQYDGYEWVGTRDATGHTDYLWALARLDGVTVDSVEDSEITLVSRLVRETP